MSYHHSIPHMPPGGPLPLHYLLPAQSFVLEILYGLSALYGYPSSLIPGLRVTFESYCDLLRQVTLVSYCDTYGQCVNSASVRSKEDKMTSCCQVYMLTSKQLDNAVQITKG